MASEQQTTRLRVVIRGAVQGVGFRPFIYRLATELKLAGWVVNSASGVFIEVEGSQPQLDEFLLRIERERPPRSFVQSLEATHLDAVGYVGFEIRESDAADEKTALILPDIATCADCLREIFDPGDRRHGYAFTNCTNCGPRFSILEALPYDRPKTSMRRFTMCPACQAEYEDPGDRRFHAQPNACPECGPQLALWDGAGKVLAEREEALKQAAEAIRGGAAVAVKGLGGFHLMADARGWQTVERLRRRKHREEKPLALMYPTLELVKRHCHVSPLEERLLASPESPIVLLARRHEAYQGKQGIAAAVAPGNPYLGVMLPYTPLHHLLLRELGFPVVATSGNISDETICTDEHEALKRLEGIADLFLVHDRPIVQHADDSIVRVIAGRESVMRRARGYAPLPVQLQVSLPRLLGVGAHMKNTVAVSLENQVFVSQHIGDLETAQTFETFKHVIGGLEQVYEHEPEAVACDLHPDYISTHYAQQRGLPVAPVQHHLAHALACMAENELVPPVLGVAWDGTGYGTDHTIWGGEFLRVDAASYERVAHLRTFRLPGGGQAVKEPRRSALGLLHAAFGDALWERDGLAPLEACTVEERRVIRTMLERGFNAPVTSSVGRLFDAVAALAGVRQVLRYEGQAAMELEFALEGTECEESYPIELGQGETGKRMPLVIDWEPLLGALLGDVAAGAPVALISAKFHNALVEAIIAVGQRVGEERVVLSGGCFQNRYLTEQAVARLREEGFRPYWHQRIPPNDGGIALGQIVGAARELAED